MVFVVSMLDHALAYAAEGWRVLPLNGKVPMIAKRDGGRGFKDATSDRGTVQRWWDRWPLANIGAAVPEDMVVLDVDPRHGGSVASLPCLPPTLTCLSGRGDGGRHFYFRVPGAGAALTSTRLPAGVDLKKGGAGYCVIPPSIHPETGGQYTWLDIVPVAFLPGSVSCLLQPMSGAGSRPKRSRAWSRVKRGELVRLILDAQVGQRNNALFFAACRAMEVGAPQEVTNALAAAGLEVGLSAREVESVLRSAARQYEIADVVDVADLGETGRGGSR